MFFDKGTRADVKAINKIAIDKNIGQLETNLYILIRDAILTNEYTNSIKDFRMEPFVINNTRTGRFAEEEFEPYFTLNSQLLSIELITPEISKSSLMSTEDLNFLRDVYSLDGTPLKSFQDLKKKYGKDFDSKHIKALYNLRTILTTRNDLVYLNNYIKDNDITISEYIDDNNGHIDVFSTKDAINVINNGIDSIEFKNKKEEIIKKALYMNLMKNKKELLIYFLEKEFENLEESYSQEIDSKLNDIVSKDTSEFIEYINKKYELNIMPSEDMIKKFEEFKNYYREKKQLKNDNLVTFVKSKKQNKNLINFDTYYLGVDEDDIELEDEDDELDYVDNESLSFAQFLMKYNYLVDSNFEKKGKKF